MPVQIESKVLTTPVTPSGAGPESASVIVGIDLGTTNSLVAIVQDGRARVLNSREGKHLLPSVVSFGSDHRPVLGTSAKEQKILQAKNTVFSAKRLLGRGYEDLESISTSLPYELVPLPSGQGEGVGIRVEDRIVSPIEISALILRELKESAEAELHCSVEKAVITVPAYFNDAQRQATRLAGRLAGLSVLRIINEPTAASLAYGLNQKREGLIAVYDLGGGTFDISILRLHEGVFEVLATHGDTTLGGDDFDQALVRHLMPELQAKWGKGFPSDAPGRAAALGAAERTKILLSDREVAPFTIEFQGLNYQRNVSREEFNQIILPILKRTERSCNQALQDAGIRALDLSDVVLVGGPTRLPVIQKFVKDLFGRVPNTSVHPDEVVAEGAAIQADILSGKNQDFLLLDVVPLSLGMETYGGIVAPFIPRNTRIPTVAKESFTTFVNNQTSVDIHVLQGEREKAEDNRSLGRFKLSGIEPMPAGLPRIDVTFMVDADGILQVSAMDQRTGKAQAIEIRPSFGLTDEEVERMLRAGIEHAEQDRKIHQLVEARNRAEPALRAAELKLPEAVRLLPETEVARIRESIEDLKHAMSQEDPQAILQKYEELNKRTIRLAELLIQDSLR